MLQLKTYFQRVGGSVQLLKYWSITLDQWSYYAPAPVTTWMEECSQENLSVHNQPLAQPSIPLRYVNQILPCPAQIKVGHILLCHICDPIWQVMLRSFEMGSHEELHASFFFEDYNSKVLTRLVPMRMTTLSWCLSCSQIIRICCRWSWVVYAESVKSCVVSINESRPATSRDSVFEPTNVTRTTSTVSYSCTHSQRSTQPPTLNQTVLIRSLNHWLKTSYETKFFVLDPVNVTHATSTVSFVHEYTQSIQAWLELFKFQLFQTSFDWYT